MTVQIADERAFSFLRVSVGPERKCEEIWLT
jgi:hypothetical protein